MLLYCACADVAARRIVVKRKRRTGEDAMALVVEALALRCVGAVKVVCANRNVFIGA
jgi:hypothetical protein